MSETATTAARLTTYRTGRRARCASPSLRASTWQSDLAINYWGSPWMAHPIASFQFADAPPICFSIETRKEIGESYSAIGGLFRQFELIYVAAADERDVIRVRTNFRRGEDVYLYRTTASPEKARERFMDYIAALNELHARPRWYNAVISNCTTSIRTQRAVADRPPWDWRILLNGKGDELMFERGSLVTGGLPFAELKERAHQRGRESRRRQTRFFSAHSHWLARLLNHKKHSTADLHVVAARFYATSSHRQKGIEAIWELGWNAAPPKPECEPKLR
jgi:uncharacterized protein DUF4105